MANLRFTSHLKDFVAKAEGKMDIAVLDMATDIHRESAMLAPKDSRALVNSGRIQKNGKANYSVVYGNDKVPYARRRHFENNLNPHTIGYLEKPGDNISRNIQRYLRGL